MTFLQAVVLGIIQGITEMLPVSSSTHLLVFSRRQDLPNQRLSFDIFLNIGSLLAIVVFFWSQVFDLIKGGIDFVCNKKSQNRDFLLTIIIANIPTIILFGLADAFLDVDFHSPFVLASSMIVFALIMWWCDSKNANEVSNQATTVSRKDAILTGITQVCSIVPGVSRLGACYSMLRYSNYSRQTAFRFSMILSLLPVAGACFLRILKIFTGHIIIENWTLVFVGCIFSFFFGLITLSFVDSFFKKHSALCFVVYRIIFGIFIITQYKIF